ncbi:MAG: hypothetical protein HQ536_04045, partial [Parcubacteria group bacterium]|nr:hypothetical protein [Parcubacteria group bacterium]
MENQDKKNQRAKLKLDALLIILKSRWLMPNQDVVRVLLAGVIAHYFETDPLWIFIIAPPS